MISMCWAFLLIGFLAFLFEGLDSSIGMGYGTLLSPILIIAGFDPLQVVPAVLLSQALGGFTASMYHHKYNNVDFSSGSRDLKIVFTICSLGVAATIFGVFVSVNILPKIWLKTYIGVMVFMMGLLVVKEAYFEFSWKKIMGIGLISAFNKGLSGGGFGPIVTGGQILSGNGHKESIGATTLAEAPICIAGFLFYMMFRVQSGLEICWPLFGSLLVGAIIAAPFGPRITRVIPRECMGKVIGLLMASLGLLTLLKTWL